MSKSQAGLVLAVALATASMVAAAQQFTMKISAPTANDVSTEYMAAMKKGIESRTGTIKVGLEADLVAFDGDPLADAATLFDPRLVITNGVIALEGLGL